MQRLTPFVLLSCVLVLVACGESQDAPVAEAAPDSPASEVAPATGDSEVNEPVAESTPAEAGEQAASIDESLYSSFGEDSNFNACEPEVIEVFSYTCIHCYRFEEFLEPWSESAEQRGISLERKALPGNQAMTTWARVHGALKLMGHADDIHHPMFERLFGEDVERIESLDDLMAFVESQGVDAEGFRSMLESEQVTEVLRADYNLMQAAGVRATPTLLINRRYKLEPSGGQGFDNMLSTVDRLVARDRQEADCPEPSA